MMFSCWPGEYSGRSTDWMRVPSMVMDPQAISVVTSMRRASHNVNGIDPYYLPCVNYFVAVSYRYDALDLSSLSEPLTDTRKYVIIITEYTGLYNIPTIPIFLTC